MTADEAAPSHRPGGGYPPLEGRTRKGPRGSGMGRGTWAVLAAAGLWGTVGPAQVLIAPTAHPAFLGAGRLLLGGAVLAAFCGGPRGLVRAARLVTRPTWVWVLLASVATAVFQISFMYAVAHTGASLATALTLGTTPIITGLAAHRWLGRPLTPGWIVAIGLAVAGLIVLVAPWGASGAVAGIGILAGVLAGICYSAYTVCAQRFLSAGAPTLPTTAITLLLAGALVTPLAAADPEGALRSPTLSFIA